MTTPEFIKEPGYTYDLFCLFAMKLNIGTIFSGPLYNFPSEEKTLYLETLDKFEPVSDDLYVFFHTLNFGKSFMTYHYFNNLLKTNYTDYNLELVMKELQNDDQVIENAIKYYLHNLSHDELQECISSKKTLFSAIKASEYSEIEKLRLYEFFMDPLPYIQKLRDELMKKNAELSAYYKRYYAQALEKHKDTSTEDIIKLISSEGRLDPSEFALKKHFVSLCLVNSVLIYHIWNDDFMINILGIDYQEYLENRKKTIRLDTLGAALSEENRVQMLDFIFEKGEVSRKELEQHFSVSSSTLYHHLNTLLCADILRTRTKGRVLLYSVNKNYFDNAIEIFRKYSNTPSEEASR